jgi:serine protease AprX
VGVAVIDTGVDGGLPDFRGDDGSSRVIASAVTNPNAKTVGDSYGHGTHVAGIIAGDGTERGADDPTEGRYVGIAPGANIISVKASDEAGDATVLDVIYGLQFVVDHKDDYNIRVVNLSLASSRAQSYKTDPLDAAVESAYFHGILPVVAAGNRGPDKDAVDYAPANDPYALTVGAVDDQGTKSIKDDKWASWSSRGTTQDGFAKPEIAAPGSHIVSTLARGSKFGRLCPSCVVDGKYIAAGGTSMAAPIAAGVAALVIQLHPDWTPDQLKTALIRSGRDLPGPIAEVNALAALPFNGRGGANAGLEPNELVDAATGGIDYTRSTWSRSTWSSAADALQTGWSRSTWSCACGSGDGDVSTARSTWSRSTWSTSWGL